MSNEEQYCGVTLLKIGQYYTSHINGYVDIPICIIGSMLNLFNILIFTRKNMISPPNLIFSHLAFVDLLILLALIPFTWICYILYGGYAHGKWTYVQAVILMFCYEFILTFHSISVFLTIMLAAWRYIALEYPFKEPHLCNMKITRKVLAAGYIINILLGVPMYLSGVIITNPSDDHTITYTHIMKNNTILPEIYFITAGVLHSLLPSVLLPIFIIRLIVVLLQKKEDQRNLRATLNAQDRERNLKRNQQTDRSIMALLTVLILFLIIKVLDGVLNLMYMIYGRLDKRTRHCFYGPRSMLLTLSAINMSITFIIYYTMSENFRTTFKSWFKSKGAALQKETVFILGNKRKPDKVPERGQV